MTGKTHFAVGCTVALALSTQQNIDAVSTVLICVGSMLPDIDHDSTKLGRTFPVIAKMFKHRHFTHSLMFCCLCSIFSPYLAIGVLTHIVTDMMTKQGVQLLFPVKNMIKLPFAKNVKTGGIFENILCSLAVITSVILCILYANTYCYTFVLNIINKITV